MPPSGATREDLGTLERRMRVGHPNVFFKKRCGQHTHTKKRYIMGLLYVYIYRSIIDIGNYCTTII